MKRDGLSNCLEYLSLRESEGPVLSRVEGCVAISLRQSEIAEPALSRAEGFHSQ
jgi:hypothetical protein